MRWNCDGDIYDDEERLSHALCDEDNLDRSGFNDEIDMNYPTVYIAGIEFYPSSILKNCDPVAYDYAFNDWADGMLADMYEDIENGLTDMSVGDELYWDGTSLTKIYSPYCAEIQRIPDEEDDEGWDDP